MLTRPKVLVLVALLLPLTVHAQTSVQPAGLGTGTSPYQIDSLPNLYWLSQTPTAWADTFTQTSDIDASTTSTWSGGFPPIGVLNGFTGSYNGNKHSIKQLTIQSSNVYTGLFSSIGTSGTLKNIGLTNAVVKSSGMFVGILAGWNRGTIIGCYVTGTDSAISTTGSPMIGGLVGENSHIISNSYTDVIVYANSSYNTATAGGLIGVNDNTVNLTTMAVDSAIISNSYSKGTNTAITTSSAISAVAYAGSLVGENIGKVNSSYAMGKAYASAPNSRNTNPTSAGALIGMDRTAATLTSYWNTTSKANACGSGSCSHTTGLDSASMFQSANFGDFDFDSIWIQYDGHTTPILRNFLIPFTITAKDTAKIYDGQLFNGNNGFTYSLPINLLEGTLTTTGTSQGAKASGIYTIQSSGFYSNQQGYFINNVPGKLTIQPKAISIIDVTAKDKVYDRNTSVILTKGSFTDTIAGDELSMITGTGFFANKNVGTSKSVTISGFSIGGKDSANYVLHWQPSVTNANITPRPISITGVTAADKVYDGTMAATLSIGTLDAITGDDVTLNVGTGAFVDANVGTAKTVTASGYSISGNDASNYTLSAQPTGLAANITPKTIHVIANTDTITQGKTNTTLTYVADSLLAGDSLTGTLTRAAGDTAGTYAILIGTLSAGGNYTIDFASANVVITAPESIRTNAPSVAFTGRASATIFNLQGKLVWFGSLDVINGHVKMPSIGEGRWVVKLQMGNTARTINTVEH